MGNQIAEIAGIIENRKRTFLDIGIFEDGTDKKLIHRKYEVDANWKKVLQAVFDTYGVSEIWIDVYAGNGNSKVFVESVTVDSSMINFQSQLPAAPALSGLGNLANVPEQFLNYMLNDKELKIKEKEEIIRELKDQRKLDLDTIEKLRERNIELERDSKFKEKEYELIKREEEIEERSNRKGSLEGIYEQATNNPQVMEIVKMFVQAKLMPGQAAYVPATALSGADPFEDPAVSPAKNEMLKNLHNWLKSRDDEFAKKFYDIVNHIAKMPHEIDNIIKRIINE